MVKYTSPLFRAFDLANSISSIFLNFVFISSLFLKKCIKTEIVVLLGDVLSNLRS